MDTSTRPIEPRDLKGADERRGWPGPTAELAPRGPGSEDDAERGRDREPRESSKEEEKSTSRADEGGDRASEAEKGGRTPSGEPCEPVREKEVKEDSTQTEKGALVDKEELSGDEGDSEGSRDRETVDKERLDRSSGREDKPQDREPSKPEDGSRTMSEGPESQEQPSRERLDSRSPSPPSPSGELPASKLPAISNSNNPFDDKIPSSNNQTPSSDQTEASDAFGSGDTSFSAPPEGFKPLPLAQGGQLMEKGPAPMDID